MEGLEHLLFSVAFDVTELLVELKLEMIGLSSENGREQALQAMMTICPGMLTGIPFKGGDTQLREVWIGKVHWGGGGLSLPGKPFLSYGFTLFAGSSKGPSGEYIQAYPLPQVNSSNGPSHVPSPNGSLYKTKGYGTTGLFCTSCLSMGNFKLSSQFKKLYEYIASTVKFLGDVS